MNHYFHILIIFWSMFFTLQGCGGGGGGSGSGPQNTGIYKAYTDLSWISPKTRTDGSYLLSSSIAGFKVYYGNDNHNLNLLVDLQESGIDEYRIGVPEAGSYFFSISAYDTQGVESELSNVVLKDAIMIEN